MSMGKPEALDETEPRRVAEAAKRLGLKHVVITSVNRDDLEDEGASHFARVIGEIKKFDQRTLIEILTPDFKRTQSEAVEKILNAADGAGPDIFNHNVETVPSLYRRVRPQGDYERSLDIFRVIRKKSSRVLAKSGLMLGLSETREEVLEVMRDLRETECEFLTLGQYLRSSAIGLPVAQYIHPEEFLNYKTQALEMGFVWVESGPFVRSSFHAKESFDKIVIARSAFRDATVIRRGRPVE